MRKIICLRLGNGTIKTGFNNILVQLYEINQGKKKLLEEIDGGSLPGNIEIAFAYQKWKLLYDSFVRDGSKNINFPTRIKFSETSIDRGNQENAAELPIQLVKEINRWLESTEFQATDRAIRDRLNLNDEVLLVVQTDEEVLRKLPWHEWSLIKKYTKAEVAISAPRFSAIGNSPTTNGKVRILAVVGDNTGIKDGIEGDLKTLRNNQDVQLEKIAQPSRQQLCDRLRDKSGWDILFYTGHSNSDADRGWLELDNDSKLEISELNLALQTAVENGLQLAIFNSCQGLGLIPQLETSGISQIIVMREIVRDTVAQTFLAKFIASFSSGQPFYLAVREARNRLKDLEDVHYCASWLPVVSQHWSTQPITWKELRDTSTIERSVVKSGSWGVVVVLSVILLRSLGLLQSLELKAFDWLMRIRPDAGVDPRLLIVEATETDINQFGYPLPDGILAQTIEQIEEHDPRVIGLQIFRDRPVGSGHQELLSSLQNSDNLIALCSAKLTDDDPNQPGISSLAQVPQQRLGFSNIELDKSDGILRRQLLFMNFDGDNPCPTEFSFSSQLALQYLNAEGIQPENLDRDRLKIGNTTFKRLQSNTGGYHNLDNRGFQLLLNYRSSEKIAETVSLTDVLNEGFNPELVKDRVVIIGVVAPVSNPTDYFSTPYSKGVLPKMSGVYVQAQMTSQILSAVLDGRPLIKTWSKSGEIIWIFIWSITGSGIAIACIKNRNFYWLILGLGIGLWAKSYLALFFFGLWLPLVPAAIAFLTSSVGGILLLDNGRKVTSLKFAKDEDIT